MNYFWEINYPIPEVRVGTILKQKDCNETKKV